MKKTLLIISLFFGVLTNSHGQSLDWAIPVADLPYANNSFTGINHAIDDEGNVYVVGDFYEEFGLANYAENIYTIEDPILGSEGNAVYIAKISAAGQILWFKNLINVIDAPGFSASPYVLVTNVEIDDSGSLIVSGQFGRQIDLNPDPNQEYILAQGPMVSSGTDASGFVAKYDSDANFIWANRIESYDSGNIMGGMAVNSVGEIIIGLYMMSGDEVTLNDDVISFYSSFLLIKLSSDGELVWTRYNESFIHDFQRQKIIVDDSDNIYLGAMCAGSSDLDPGDEIVYPNGSSSDLDQYIFILKLTNDGEYVWNYSIPTDDPWPVAYPGYATGINDFEIDNNGNIIAVGNHVVSIDFDPGTGEAISETEAGGFILKLSATGEFDSYRPLPLAKFESMAIGSLNEMYLSGNTSSLTDFDPSDDEFSLAADVGFIAKYSSDGVLIYAKDFGDFPGISSGKITVTPGDEVIYTGLSSYDTMSFEDFDSPLVLNYTSSAVYRPLIFKLGTSPCQGFIANIADNENVVCGEEDSGYASVSVTGGALPYVFSWSGAPEALTHELYTNSTGIYTVTVTEAGGCSHTMSTLINGPANGGVDYQVLPTTFTSSAMFVPGLETTVGVTVKNMSCDTDAAVIKVVLEGDITFVSSTITPTSIVGDTLFFNSEQINYSNDFHTSVVVTTNPTAQMGDLVCVEVIVDSQDDINSENNYAQVCRNVLTSYDPNAKSVYPLGACEENYVPLNQKLTYTAQFQNTGTFAAINVYMMDTLSQYLDISTLNILDKTHDMVVEIYDGNIVKFRFDNIWLADSTSNEAESHGHVIFEISPIENIASGTVVENDVAIYFDFNEPVVTNTVRNTFVSVIPQCVVSVTKSEIPSLLSAYPNPARDFVYIKSNDANTNKPVKLCVIDISGKVVLQDNAYMINTTPLNVSTLAQGVYMITLSNEEGNSYARFVKE